MEKAECFVNPPEFGPSRIYRFYVHELMEILIVISIYYIEQNYTFYNYNKYR